METGYSEHDWATLLFAPLWVFQAALGANGTINDRGWRLFAQTCRSAREYQSDLSEDVFAELAAHFDEMRAGFEREEADVNDGLAEVVALLEREDEVNIRGFKADMIAMAIQVARAVGASDLGNGQVLDRLCAVLGISEDDCYRAISWADRSAGGL